MTQDEQGAPSAVKVEKTVTIRVNGRAREVPKGDMTYADIVALAFDGHPPTGENVVITVTYTKGEDHREASLLPGQSVKVKEEMIFDVVATDRS